MNIKYRNYESPDDLRRQDEFWLRVTHDLPWAWKPNKSQANFVSDAKFDPRSKLYAYEGNKLVGYMSCIRRPTFVPFGYPWVLQGYESVREELYNRMYEFTRKEWQATSYLQRFRKEWKAQTSFFEERGFTLKGSSPIYVKKVPGAMRENANAHFKSQVEQKFPAEIFAALAKSDPQYAGKDIEFWKSIYAVDMDLDGTLLLTSDGRPKALVAFTIRPDTHYAETNLCAAEGGNLEYLHAALQHAWSELADWEVEHISVTTDENSPLIPFLETSSFELRSASVFYSKDIAA